MGKVGQDLGEQPQSWGDAVWEPMVRAELSRSRACRRNLEGDVIGAREEGAGLEKLEGIWEIPWQELGDGLGVGSEGEGGTWEDPRLLGEGVVVILSAEKGWGAQEDLEGGRSPEFTLGHMEFPVAM